MARVEGAVLIRAPLDAVYALAKRVEDFPTFMPDLENPFRSAEAEVTRLRLHTKIIFVDFHAEATSEKIAFKRR